jgi:hypothetical protein
MALRSLLAKLVAGLLVAALSEAQSQTNHVVVKVDGAEVPGVLGYRIEFVRQPLPKTDSRRLDLSYSPNQRMLSLTVTQKGLKALQEWLNQAFDGGTPAAKVVTLTSLSDTDAVLVTWQLSGTLPTTVSQASAGQLNEISATLEFLFDQIRLVEVSGN